MNHDPKLTPFQLVRISRAPAGGEGGRNAAGAPLAEEPLFSSSDAVASLRLTLLSLVRRDGRDLTARQLTAFMTVYLDGQVHTVSSMAEMLNISRPGVTRIVDRLAEYDLVERQEDHADRRRVLIRRTPRGKAFMHELNAIASNARNAGQA